MEVNPGLVSKIGYNFLNLQFLYYNRRNCSQAAIKLKTHRRDAEDSEKETLK
jgi:hypothetical protein